ncbi:metalloregulator ArsR/SmtB family transcription factor [Kineococcus sp. SYSU DK018]|uniref:metalloregulator ArsR/SmtB family transcription factor n=1 Tax=Kineococcus sp. SYSU DK018 TaxID=3383139 RepID=UPI003D7D3EB7
MTTSTLPAAPPARPVAGATCCAPLTGRPLSAEDAAVLARSLKAIADPARLRLLSLVAAHAGGEACACDLTEPLGLSQPTVSHHLKVLVEAGLLTRDKRGVWAYYAVVPEALDALAAVLTTTPADGRAARP